MKSLNEMSLHRNTVRQLTWEELRLDRLLLASHFNFYDRTWGLPRFSDISAAEIRFFTRAVASESPRRSTHFSDPAQGGPHASGLASRRTSIQRRRALAKP